MDDATMSDYTNRDEYEQVALLVPGDLCYLKQLPDDFCGWVEVEGHSEPVSIADNNRNGGICDCCQKDFFHSREIGDSGDYRPPRLRILSTVGKPNR